MTESAQICRHKLRYPDLVFLPLLFEVASIESAHDIVGVFRACRPRWPAGHHQPLLILPADIQRHVQPLRMLLPSDVIEQHRTGSDDAAGIRVLKRPSSPFWAQIVDRLKHGIALAYVALPAVPLLPETRRLHRSVCRRTGWAGRTPGTPTSSPCRSAWRS